MIRICVLNWNGGIHLHECIKSIQKNQYKDFKISVIDNNSTDGSLSSLPGNVEIIKLDKNYGFGKGYNLGIEKCVTDNDQYLILLNYDTIVPNNFVHSIFENKNGINAGHIYGVKILYHSNRELIWYAGGEVDLSKGLISHRGIGKHINSFLKDENTDYITGCCMIMHKDIFFKLKGFDERFFMYNEDVDLCLRAREIGIKSRFLSNVTLLHKISLSLGGNYSIKKILIKTKSCYQIFNKKYSLLTSIFLLSKYIIRSILK